MTNTNKLLYIGQHLSLCNFQPQARYFLLEKSILRSRVLFCNSVVLYSSTVEFAY